MTPELIAALGIACTVVAGIAAAYWATLECRYQAGRADQRAADAIDYARNPVAFEARVCRDAIDRMEATYGADVFGG